MGSLLYFILITIATVDGRYDIHRKDCTINYVFSLSVCGTV